MHKWALVWQEATYNYIPTLHKKPKKTLKGVSFSVDYQLPNSSADVTIVYEITANGELDIAFKFSPNQKELPNIPRLGMYLTLPVTYTDVSWYGKGPKETYWDRKTGAKTAVYHGTTANEFERYSRPQETGNKTDIRWFTVSSKKLALKASGSSTLLNGSIWPFTMKEIDFNNDLDATASASGLVPVTKKHGAEIKLGTRLQWNIDYLQMGVGGDTSWGRLVHPEYTISANKTYQYSFRITPIKKLDLLY